ncbi:SAWADEE domain [Dillenia turbinata]|uniref:SAWADEE domain n=1 Tax=Dillenia turbinata TaxID=194707 RepID=A0AAN8UIU9_9MAGN
MPGDERFGLSELTFEARSSRDLAWVLGSGELEARIRFAGFGYADDEWVNVKRGIHERSIPLEPTECHLVKVEDLVLCFQER